VYTTGPTLWSVKDNLSLGFVQETTTPLPIPDFPHDKDAEPVIF